MPILRRETEKLIEYTMVDGSVISVQKEDGPGLLLRVEFAPSHPDHGKGWAEVTAAFDAAQDVENVT